MTDLTADSYTTPTDLLVATVLGEGKKATDNAGVVPMTFDHVMSKLIVNLSYRTQWATNPTVTSVSVTAKASSTVNYLTKVVSATGEASPLSLTSVTANSCYASIVAPQDVNKIDIVIDGKTYTYTHSGNITLEKGKIQTVNLIVGRDKIEQGSILINDWEAGDTIDGGEAQGN